MNACPFCAPDRTRVFSDDQPLMFCMWDGFPVSPGHALVIPRRHVSDWFDATKDEQLALLEGIALARAEIDKHYAPDGFNVGVNVGASGGQTVPHLHVHVIPRYVGDVPDPRGGVRHVIPALGNYLVTSPQSESNPQGDRSVAEKVVSTYIHAPEQARRVFGTSRQYPLLPALIEDLARADQIDLAVAFVLEKGLRLLMVHLEDLLERGGYIRILTGDYLDATEPEALQLLLDLRDHAVERGRGRVEARVFETRGRGSFHPKAYMISKDARAVAAYIGSSNVSATALSSAVEWNYRFTPTDEARALGRLRAEFESLFLHANSQPLSREWVSDYRQRRRVQLGRAEPIAVDPSIDMAELPKPHEVQSEALVALSAGRREGHRAGLVVLATGLGKTWLAAFDSEQFERVLFVAHREEILQQARDTFRRIRPMSRLGLYTGEEKDGEADVLFASIATLGKSVHLSRFERDRFSYIVIDEFHHAEAATYRRLIDYFEPAFLLGLTATPDRTDGADLLRLCGNNEVYRCDLLEGIRRELLSPFHYLGVPDVVDYRNIPWKSGKFDPAALEAEVATQRRAQNAFEQWSKYRRTRTLAFCVSTKHASFMSNYFADRGARCVAVHSGPGSAPRGQALEELRAGVLDVVFSVDMLNEGVDVPMVDTVLMLRPTESKILWLQQFGRGLRKADDKPFVQVIDYIGNHRTFTQGAMALLPSAEQRLGELNMALERLVAGDIALPPGCEVVYELEALQILRALAAPPGTVDAMTAWFQSFREKYGSRPTASEAYDAGFDPRSVRRQFGGWLAFVDALQALSSDESETFKANRRFLESLDVTPMTKSYKMLVLLAMIAEGRFPGGIEIDSLVNAFRHQAMGTMALRADVGNVMDSNASLRRMLEQNPINAWVGGHGTADESFFRYTDDVFSTNEKLTHNQSGCLGSLTRELCEWRLAVYADRSADDPVAFAIRRDDLATTDAAEADGPELWKEYSRREIPPLFGLQFETGSWNQGYVRKGNLVFLLVSLNKESLAAEHRYADIFVSDSLFRWQSQNQHRQDSAVGKLLKNHVSDGVHVHLFVRRDRKLRGSQGAPFTYCGEVKFVDWSGDEPITIDWKLDPPLANHLIGLFGIEL
jgi:superfamily II DNA or RNA helicase/diadenosine tetraphosphate (Ap4A) HIT family hydrolase